MSDFWENELVEIAAYYSVAVLCLVLFLTVFELVTAYKNWEEIQKGNLAVAMATGGKILGIANVFQHSISQHNSSAANDRLGRLRVCYASDQLLYF